MQKFTKYHGTGNDFILIDNRSLTFTKERDYIALLCHRHLGIGADGLILLENPKNPEVDFKMVYYNADGNTGTMCGNGGRCLVHFAHSLGIIADKTEFEAVDGIHEARYLPDKIDLKLGDVKSYKTFKNTCILNTGSPHYVTFVKDLKNINVTQAGREVRYSSEFEKNGINVNFVQLDSPFHLLRTYERGVEAETLSCGTGAVATAIAIAIQGHIPATIENTVKLKTVGGKLKVHFQRHQDHFSEVWLSGPAKEVFTGILQSESHLKQK